MAELYAIGDFVDDGGWTGDPGLGVGDFAFADDSGSVAGGADDASGYVSAGDAVDAGVSGDVVVTTTSTPDASFPTSVGPGSMQTAPAQAPIGPGTDTPPTTSATPWGKYALGVGVAGLLGWLVYRWMMKPRSNPRRRRKGRRKGRR